MRIVQAFCCIEFIIILGLLSVVGKQGADVATPCEASDVIKTVSHIDLSANKNLECIYVDSINDISYYRTLDSKDLVSIGDTVYTSKNDSTEVIATDVYGFYVKYNDVFYPGMSGTVIRNADGEGVGYVSTVLDSDTVYCIWR